MLLGLIITHVILFAIVTGLSLAVFILIKEHGELKDKVCWHTREFVKMKANREQEWRYESD